MISDAAIPIDPRKSFVHLHLHTEYSTLDGAIKIGDLASKAVEFGMPAVAMTDHGNLFGAIEFYQKMHKAGIKPILGCEAYLAPTSHTEKKEIPGRKRTTHFTLLCENNKGWENLTKLISCAHLDGQYYAKARVDYELLEKYSEGLICLSGCISSPINEWLLKDDYEKAKEVAERFLAIFGKENYFIEIHDHGLEAQRKVRSGLIQIAQELDLRLVAANDAHFLTREDHEAHDVLICIGTGSKRIDENRMKYSPEVYFKSPAEMRELFSDMPEACDVTLEIAERCNVTMVLDPTSTAKYPQFGTPDGSPLDEYLRKVCFQGLEMRYGKERAETDQELRERLDYEVKTINDLKFASYFLITADFIKWAKDENIPVGPGRGSAAGSLVAYCMEITDICPIRFGLLFERFLNPERVSPPDVDIDFCVNRRMEVIDYVRQKYGEESVSHIITYGKLGAKSVIRDVARVMDIGYNEADSIAKLIDTKPGVKLANEWKSNAELKEKIESSSTYKDLWRYALSLEGLCRNTGVHAAGVVIGDKALDNHVPLTRGNEGEVVAQYDMGAITDVGLLKMDFLGLKNLTVIQEAVEHIRVHTPEFKINDVTLEDPLTYDLLDRGETMGVFQLESGGMTETCKKYRVRKIEDIIDLLALYRPGAMQYIDEMIEVKEGRKEVTYEHPLMEEISGDTYGVMIYQEQVQNAAKLLAGYTLGGADVLRRAMGKKKPEEMAKQREIFTEGCWKTNGIQMGLANQIFDKIAGFAGYGFNKSHSACYGMISYWTAYLKANFPVEFMAALLSNEINNTDKIGLLVSECYRMGIEILPPDLNRSQLRFSPEKMRNGEISIRYGLAAVKNVGEAAMDTLIRDREENGTFESLDDMANRLDGKVVNRRILENLIKVGALDWSGETRAGMTLRLESVLSLASSIQKDRESGQGALFGLEDTPSGPAPTAEGVKEIEEWPKEDCLIHEKDLLGFYVSGHPLQKFRGVIDSAGYTALGSLSELDTSDRRKRYKFGGMISLVEHKTTKAGKPFGVIHVEDFTGDAEVVCWSESYLPAKEAGLLEPGTVIRFESGVTVDDRTEAVKIANASKISIVKTTAKKTKGLEISLNVLRHGEKDLEKIKEILSRHSGKTDLYFRFTGSRGRSALMSVGDDHKVCLSEDLKGELSRWIEAG